nr:hypothetical protein [Brevibacillus laterosporus]
MDKLREDENYSIADFNCEIDEGFFRNNQFFITAVNTKTYIALLASNDPRSFISGAPIDLSKVLKNCNKNEFHHVLRLDAPSFPLEQLRAQLTLTPAHCTIDNWGPICNPYNSSPCSNAQKNT